MNPIKAMADIINRNVVKAKAPAICNEAICGASYCGSYSTGAIISGGLVVELCPATTFIPPARCNEAICGASYCGDDGVSAVSAGMIPLKVCPDRVTMALVELPGSPADQRQIYHTAFDNPSMILHIIGNDLLSLDAVADEVIKTLDRTGHYDTTFGTVNGVRIGPPRRTVRNDRPRYDLQLTIDMETART